MKMILSPINDGDLLYITRNMRAADRAEIFATRWSEDDNRLVDDCMAVSAAPTSYSVIAGLEKPIAVLGAIQVWPGVWDLWCFGTNDFSKIAFSLTKHIRRTMVPLVVDRGAHRAHCRSMASHTQAHAWLHDLGARPSSDRILKGWGKDGEDFIEFSWHLEDIKKEKAA